MLICALGSVIIGGASAAAVFVKVYGLVFMVFFSVTTIHFVMRTFTPTATVVAVS